MTVPAETQRRKYHAMWLVLTERCFQGRWLVVRSRHCSPGQIMMLEREAFPRSTWAWQLTLLTQVENRKDVVVLSDVLTAGCMCTHFSCALWKLLIIQQVGGDLVAVYNVDPPVQLGWGAFFFFVLMPDLLLCQYEDMRIDFQGLWLSNSLQFCSRAVLYLIFSEDVRQVFVTVTCCSFGNLSKREYEAATGLIFLKAFCVN